MNINKVTITGLDTVAEIDRIIELQKQYPFCEWGILFSGNKEGQPRYPAMWVVEKIIKSGIPLSAHFCGAWSRDVLENQKFSLIKCLHPNFSRVQLNYNFSYNQKWSIPHLNLFAEENQDRAIIVQYNKRNKVVIDNFHISFPDNINILYDASGGRGTEIEEVYFPFPNYTGYAGGISPTNIKRICEIITVRPNNSNVWIDMESGVRTDNAIDFDKVESVLKTCSKFIKSVPII